MPEGKALAVSKAECTRTYASILGRLITQPSGIRWGFENNLEGTVEESAYSLRVKKGGFWGHGAAAAADAFHVLNTNVIGDNRQLRCFLHHSVHTFCEISLVFNFIGPILLFPWYAQNVLNNKIMRHC